MSPSASVCLLSSTYLAISPEGSQNQNHWACETTHGLVNARAREPLKTRCVNARRSNAKHRPREPRDDHDRLLRRPPAWRFQGRGGAARSDVSWQGLREEWVCHGREEVVDTFRWGLEQRREIDALEFTRGGEQVVLGARGPSIDAVEDEPLEGQIFNVFTLRDGPIARIDDYRGRREAPRAAGLAE